MTTKSEEDKIVRDGERVRVPMLLMDELQLSVHAAALHDGLGNRAGYKPGFVFGRNTDGATVSDAYHAYVYDIGEQWHGSPATSPTPTTDAHAEYVTNLGNAWRSL